MTALAKLFRATAFKLTLAILGVSALGAGMVLGIVAWQVIKLVDEEMKQTIEAEANGLAEQYELGGVRRLDSAIEARSREPGSTLYLLTNSAGEPLAGNISQLPPGVLDHVGFVDTTYEATDASTARQEGARAHIRVAGRVSPPRRARSRRSGADRRGDGARARDLADFPGRARRARRAVRRAARAAAHRRDEQFGARDHGRRSLAAAARLGSGDELDRLALGLNEMLARIADLMAGLREVSDNIAHDLRTPLTRLRNHVEEALRQDGDPSAYRAALERTIEESDGLIRIFDALLMIARAEAGADRAGMSAFDVGGVVTGVAELYEPVAEEKGFEMTVAVSPGLTMTGNRELIGQAIANLIDNALKYGAADVGAAAAGSTSSRGARARKSSSRSPITDPASAMPIASACSIVSCGSRARVRAPVPGSACRSRRRWRACMAGPCGSRTTRRA